MGTRGISPPVIHVDQVRSGVGACPHGHQVLLYAQQSYSSFPTHKSEMYYRYNVLPVNELTVKCAICTHADMYCCWHHLPPLLMLLPHRQLL